MWWTTVLLAVAVLASACVDPLTSKRPVTEPEFYAKNVKAYAETAAGLPPDVAFGWRLTVSGDVARWFECTAIDVCGQVERQRPARELLAVERVEEAVVEGRPVEVLKLSLAPRPSYIVPNFKPQR
jgi:hypothetical protein